MCAPESARKSSSQHAKYYIGKVLDLELYSTDCQPFLHDNFCSNHKYMPRFQQTKIHWLRFTSQDLISKVYRTVKNNRRLTETAPGLGMCRPCISHKSVKKWRKFCALLLCLYKEQPFCHCSLNSLRPPSIPKNIKISLETEHLKYFQ